MNNSEQTPVPDDWQTNVALADYMRRVDSGEAIDPADFVAKHPELAEELRSLFDTARVVEEMAGPTRLEQAARETAKSPAVTETIAIAGGADHKRRASSDLPDDVSRAFGRYRIKRPLGQGAMGSVYLAHDTQLHRDVALKIPKFVGEHQEETKRRFYREARATATLRSPNICPVYDVDQIEGVLYLTMAYIEGPTLAQVLRARSAGAGGARDGLSGRAASDIEVAAGTGSPAVGGSQQPERPVLDDRQIAAIVRKLAAALQRAHDTGIVHRDLKPGNIMIDADGEPIVMDFGLAHRADDDVRVTQTGAVVGSPAYMSPEQVRGDPDKIAPATDIYSLGVVLFEMLTGELPFTGSMMSVIRQIAHNEPPQIEELRAGADRRLAAICRKMMAKRVEDRYQSMSAVAAALDAYLHDRPQTLAEPRKPNWARLTAMAALPLLAALAATVFFLRTQHGTVRVEINDPSITVELAGTTVTFQDSQGEPIEVKPGEHLLAVKRGDFEFQTKSFVLGKGDNPPLKVEFLAGEVVVRQGERVLERHAIPQPDRAAVAEKHPSQTQPAKKLLILVDASKDGGVWWFPQAPPNFAPEEPHQGKALADDLK